MRDVRTGRLCHGRYADRDSDDADDADDDEEDDEDDLGYGNGSHMSRSERA